MRLKILFVLLLAWGLPAHAQFSLAGLAGYGFARQSYTSSGALAEEGPLSFAVNVDLSRVPSRSFRMGVSHLRSFQLTPLSSGLAFSLVTLKAYYLGGPDVAVKSGPWEITTFGFYPYLNAGLGIYQGVVEGSNSTGIGAYGALGLDWIFMRSTFLRFEAGFAYGQGDSRVSLISGQTGLGFLF